MFKTITRLFFGGEEEKTHDDVKSGEVVEEGWLVVSHQDAGSTENIGAELTDTQPPNSALHGDTNMESDISVLDVEPRDQSSSCTTGPQPKALLEMTQLSGIQKTKTWIDPHHMSRNAIQRQNRVRQGVHHHYFHLQQPGHRHLSH